MKKAASILLSCLLAVFGLCSCEVSNIEGGIPDQSEVTASSSAADTDTSAEPTTDGTAAATTSKKPAATTTPTTKTTQPSLSPDTVKILFIGNSLTYEPKLPEQLEAIARSKGKSVWCELLAYPDYTLEMHWNRLSPRYFQEHRYDYVILQEHGLPPVADYDNFRKYAGLFADAVSLGGAVPVLYITSRSSDENGIAQAWRQDELTGAYLQVSRDIQAPIMPSGPAWVTANERDPLLRFYQGDQLHPNMLGGYLTACTLYSTLFGESAEGADYSLAGNELKKYGDRGAEIAGRLQQVAWETLQDYLPQPTAPTITLAPVTDKAAA
ncbi:MAG: SGNH/GDSL hydrolase family protein [Clostridiales bacterium]|nr:SGNH/GDSL hydrolase family protein [Clostridiales bacterium]